MQPRTLGAVPARGQRISPEQCERMSERSAALWQDENFRKSAIEKLRAAWRERGGRTAEDRARIGARSRRMWSDPAFRAKMRRAFSLGEEGGGPAGTLRGLAPLHRGCCTQPCQAGNGAEDGTSPRAYVPWRAAYRRRLPRARARRVTGVASSVGRRDCRALQPQQLALDALRRHHEIAQVRLDDEHVEPSSLQRSRRAAG